MNTSHKIASTALAIAAATTATAGTAHLNIVTGQAPSGVDISITVQESNLAGYDFEFVIENNTHCDDAGITGIYFESGWGDLLSNSPFDRNLRRDESPLNFSEGSATPDVAGWSSTLVSYQVMGGLGNGVHTGHTATVAFVANTDVTLEDLDSVLASQGFGLALRLQDMFEEDPNAAAWGLAAAGESQVNHQCGIGQGTLPIENEEPEGNGGNEQATGVPTPSAALMGLALLGFTAKRRRQA